MLVLNTPRSRLPSVFIIGELRLPSVFTIKKSRLPSVFATRKSRLSGVLITEELFWTPRSHFTDSKEHRTILKRRSFYLIVVTYLLREMWFMFEKITLPKESNRLPSVFITGEAITSLNNSTNIGKTSKSFLGVPNGTREVVWLKNRRENLVTPSFQQC